MKIVIGQVNPTIGDFEYNFKLIKNTYKKGIEFAADLVVLPEMVITGYPPKDLLERDNFCKRAFEYNELIVDLTEDIPILFGSIQKNDKIGRKIYNVGILAKNKKIVGCARKILLPYYDVFDETRYFEPGDSPFFINIANKNILITICEDLWGLGEGGCLYGKNPIKDVLCRNKDKQKIDLAINISASPYHYMKFNQRKEIFSNIAKEFEFDLLYVNCVGANDELIFDGASFFMTSTGQLKFLASFFEENISYIDTDMLSFENKSFDDNFDVTELMYKALVFGLKEYGKKTHFNGAVLGLSGGIDSSLTACIACDAFGNENVMGLIMNSPYNSKESLEDALELSKNLNIKSVIIPIEPLMKSYDESLADIFRGYDKDVTEENLQARIRGNLLMAVSNKFGKILLSTGNKSEMAVGYTTLYGDLTGGLAVISDVYKEDVYKIAKWLNSKKKVIPERVFTKKPSAELRPGQYDQEKLPPYEILDKILKLFIEEAKSINEIVSYGFDRNTVREVVSMIVKNEYKRRQAPPTLKVTGKAFGYGRRYPIAMKPKLDDL
ncbi:NAD+ synthase (glutamine-hydrolysing) [Thermodesulfobium acidiphilum]|uniref:Glutamine-dependent NAD(+) synthetase n=1 Tax=Thermodesulfobium acidiphilum TaxID=1794699 RepID=A0A2R4W076_THEAF|nr:NAD+ synthase [Thermodesulfobium acidiphilum]AWB10211.1 NAD+ synthase (glutamine-hydrolysing) [Thermodesulfobium acidiphilum]